MITKDEDVVEKKVKGKKKKFIEVIEQNGVELIEDDLIPEEMPADLRDTRYSNFKIKKIVIGACRELHLEVMRTFEKTYTNYVVELTVDLDTMNWRIEEKKKAKQNYELQNQMDAFDDLKKRELEEYDKAIERLEAEKAERIAQCPKISFEGAVTSYNKKLTSTDFVIRIPKDIVSELNDKIDFSDNYKIELIKNLNNA